MSIDRVMTLRKAPRRRAVGLAAAACCLGLCTAASAIGIDVGNDDVQVRFDNTVRYNLGLRADSQNEAILRAINNDDGDRNFKRHAIVTNRIDLLSEFDVVYRKSLGARVSGAAWYDQAYTGALDNTSVATSNHLAGGVQALGLSNVTRRYFKGASGEFLDAFVFAAGDVGGMAATLRLGRHTINWGEALLGGGAIHGISYGQAPLDQAKALATPGIEAKELYRPLNQVSGQIQVTPTLSLAAQYYLEWKSYRFPEAGSYLGFSDALLDGGEAILLPVGGTTRLVTRAADVKPKDRGDWGLAMRWSPEWLDGTAGLYYRKFSDKVPQQATLRPTASPPIPQQYLLMYGSDIEMLGLSLTRQIAGISVGVDLNHRRNMPLVSGGVNLVTATTALPQPGQTLGARGNTWHAVVNAIGSLPSTPLYNAASWNAELTWSHWSKVTSDPYNVFKGSATYAANAANIDRVTKDAVGIAIGFTPTWYQVFPGADLALPVSASIGVDGNSAVSLGGNKGAGSYAIGLALDVQSRYRFDLKYVDYFGSFNTNATTGAVAVYNGSTAMLKDRGAVYFTFKTTF
ncbi:MAG: DUF1302 domain-containing protein [Proteobacteria bacterium]|nr:DUF1302 domain-containing protein [Pseudomonadota bacterium]